MLRGTKGAQDFLLVLFAGAFVADAFLVTVLVFLAGALVADAFLAVLAFLAGALVAAFLTVLVFLAGALVAAFLAVLVFLAGAFFAAALEDGVDFLAVVALAVVDVAGAVLFAVVVGASVSFGSFFAPDTTFLSSWPGLNFGTAFFLVRIRSPVAGLRAQPAARTRFSKEPKPVIATFSPLATSRVMVSSTDSKACWALLRLPSNRAASVSTS